jgi:hypothetical protein
MKKVHPLVFTLFSAVVALFLSFAGFLYAGQTVLFILLFALHETIGVAAGLSWPVLPWQVGITAGIPSFLFLIWHLLTAANPMEAGLSLSSFAFLPILAVASSYFGTILGRWIAIKRRQRAVAAGGK